MKALDLHAALEEGKSAAEILELFAKEANDEANYNDKQAALYSKRSSIRSAYIQAAALAGERANAYMLAASVARAAANWKRKND